MSLRDTRAGSLSDKQEELEATVQQENCDILAIMEHGGMTHTTGVRWLQTLQKGQVRKERSWVVLCVREWFDCLELNDDDDRVGFYG